MRQATAGAATPVETAEPVEAAGRVEAGASGTLTEQRRSGGRRRSARSGVGHRRGVGVRGGVGRVGVHVAEQQELRLLPLLHLLDVPGDSGDQIDVQFDRSPDDPGNSTGYGGAVTDLAPSVLSVTIAKLIPASGNKPAHWQSYVNRNQNASAGPKPLAKAIQANTEGGANGVLEQLATPGKYRYTYKVDLAAVTTPLAVSYEPALTHRVGLEIRMSGAAEELAPDNPVLDFVPDGGVLELGCHKGDMTAQILEYFPRVTAVEAADGLAADEWKDRKRDGCRPCESSSSPRWAHDISHVLTMRRAGRVFRRVRAGRRDSVNSRAHPPCAPAGVVSWAATRFSQRRPMSPRVAMASTRSCSR